LDAISRQLRLLDKRLEEKARPLQLIFTRAPLLSAAIGLIAGIFIQNLFNLPIAGPLIILVLAGIATVVFYFQKPPLRLYGLAFAACLAFVCLGAIRLTTFYQPGTNDIRNFIGSQRRLASLRGSIITTPYIEDKTSWKFGRYTFGEPATSFYMKLDSVKTTAGWADACGDIRVRISEPVEELRPGHRIRIMCWLDRFGGPLNPGQFNFARYLKQRRVFVGASVKSLQAVEILSEPAGSWAGLTYKLKGFAAEALLGEDEPDGQSEAMLAALLLGRRANLGSETYNAFRRTGLAHFISLSGMHIGILAGFIWWVCRTAGLSKRKRAVALFLLITLYVMIVPPRAPTLRAAMLCWFFCISVIVRKRAYPLNTLSLTAIVLLLIRPADAFSAGLQLSFMTVLGIILFYERIEDLLLKLTIDRMGWLQQNDNMAFRSNLISGLWRAVVTTISVGLAAWLGGAGILLYHFGTITPLAALWTVISLPLVFAILAVGFAKIALTIFLPTLALIISPIAEGLANLFIWIVRIIDSVNFSYILIGKVSVGVIICYYLLLGVWRFGYIRKPVIKKLICALLGLAVFIPIGAAKSKSIYHNDLRLTCLAVGHGQALLAELPRKGNLLIDAGSLSSKDIGRRIVAPFLRQKGIGRLDAIVLSHDDSDHINGIPEIILELQTNSVYANSAFLDKSRTRSTAGFLADCLYRENIELKNSNKMVFDSKAKIRLLWPDEKTCMDETISDNDKSHVILIEYAGKSILICSDIEKLAQQQLLNLYPDLKADAVIMPHHGSTKNLVDGFIEKLNPQAVIISCSKSRYETAYKPEEPTCAFYTPVDGAVSIKITPDGKLAIDTFIKATSKTGIDKNF